MQIKQLVNRKIQFWEGGNIQFSCLPGQNYKVINQDEIQLLTVGQKPFSLFAKDIDFTAILGGVLTAVSFADSQELAEYLDLNFFFELGGGTDNIIVGYGDTGEYNQGHSAIKPVISTSTALVAGTQYTIPIYLSGFYNEFALIQISLIAGAKFNFAIYEGDKTGAFLPKNKVFQSIEFTTPGARSLLQNLVSPAVYFAPSWYYFSYIADNALTFTGTRVANTFSGWSLTGTPAIASITRYFKAGVYASTLPAVHPSFSSDLGNPSNPILFYKKQV